ncbi:MULTISPECIES: TetR/AcrR family transcriptional regulator [Staphylococcus]|jgi:AcrR family transcriptional regulator|uniref:Rut operon repressor n=2 Tax=Staphylococcus nepalensis TaxID=214473 RepID=A0A380GL02_9STAP|nr:MULTISPECIES: TetR/AcrR family transcriptional regulator [Staphylococcus]VDG66286.1 AcrR family transcriptional regulator [Lacrimispora indolis]MBO1205671.1 TetR/AcrR family transcriptional regulator [Staphylococcus nepalensis]MBO1221133.1 TetR/AcrR family transcriptional regulator [Staphylococcus nepalensis]MCD8891820.1 TetR/AcrR family transcriptional regulator [Staphylococcus nepalensis]MDR5649078.1 TetR/AcrR family transcriptional regulator [Staphylococcus nepalensis]
MENKNSMKRKNEILEASLIAFSKNGYFKTTTAHIATIAGISQPYVFKFFKTKEALFIAALNQAFERIIESFEQIKSNNADIVEDMITAYETISNKYPNEVNIQVIAFSVTEENIQNTVRTGLLKIRDYALKRFENENVNNPENEVTTFLARGILCNISQFINLPSLINRNLNK